MVEFEVSPSQVKSVPEMLINPVVKDQPPINKVELEPLKAGSDLIEIKELPSHFKLYNTNLIHIRGLKTGEVKSLNKIVSNRDLQSLARVYGNVISGVKIEDMLPIDFKALMFFIAKLTDPDFNLNLNTKCRKCEEYFNSTIDIDSIDYQELNSDVIEVGELKFRPIRIKDTVFLETIVKINDSKEDEVDKYDLDISTLAVMSDYEIANKNSMKIFDIQYEKIWELPNNPYAKKLERVVEELVLDVKEVNLTCTHCAHNFDSRIVIDYSRIYL